MSSKIRVAIFCDTYIPGFRGGGPPVSISRIVDNELNAEIRVITRDRDGASASNESYEVARTREWVQIGPALVAYLRIGAADWPWVVSQIRAWQPDLIYINSLQSPWFALLPLVLVRARVIMTPTILIAPRGECSLGAQRIKPAKKRFSRPAIRRLLRGPLVWHASSEDEARDIRRWWGTSIPRAHRMIVEPDPAPTPDERQSALPPSERLLIVFASRIDRMKGLSDFLGAIKDTRTDMDVDVHGFIKDPDYWAECLAMAERLPPNVRFRYLGEFKPAQAKELMCQADLFVLLTHGENFGQAIAEAMAVGCPVLISDRTIWNEVASQGGFIVHDVSEVEPIISRYSQQPAVERSQRRQQTWAAYRAWYGENAPGGQLFEAALRSKEDD